jgi:hypothetical protein
MLVVMRRAIPLLLLLGLLLGSVRAQDDAETDESTPAYEKALELIEKRKWRAAQIAFRKFIEKYPDSIHLEDAEYRSGKNCYMGVTRIYETGPPERRIDVSVMGDGFTIAPKDQALEEKWAKLCVDVLFNEKSFDEYRGYFNFYFVRLVSFEERVDPVYSDEELAKIEEKNKRRAKKKKTDYDTALDCKAAGPGGQVMANRGLVFKWLSVAAGDDPGCANDQQVIAFARFGVLGMAGGGVANVGRPDKSITVHEFGHSFSGLADEYQGNPNPPRWQIRAPNAATTDDPEKVPWAHFLKARVKGVGIYEGGATFNKGVWRPARSCAMNAAGNNQFCPVCREQNVLTIYSYVDPIDAAAPDPTVPVAAVEGDDTELTVTVMRPRTRPLKVYWFVKPLEPGEEVVSPRSAPAPDERWRNPYGDGMRGMAGYRAGRRGSGSRSHLDDPPAGELRKHGKAKKGGRGKPKVHYLPVGKLPPGRYAVTAVVKDETPWVLKDLRHLLEEREVWTVLVEPKE